MANSDTQRREAFLLVVVKEVDVIRHDRFDGVRLCPAEATICLYLLASFVPAV